MPVTTKIILLPYRQRDINDSSQSSKDLDHKEGGHDSQIFRQQMDVITKFPGFETDHKDTLVFLADWKSCPIKFAGFDIYKTVSDGPAQFVGCSLIDVLHVYFDDPIEPILDEHTTQVVLCLVSSAAMEDPSSPAHERFAGFCKGFLQPETKGLVGRAAGWATEEVERDGEKFKVYLYLVAWKSCEEQAAFVEALEPDASNLVCFNTIRVDMKGEPWSERDAQDALTTEKQAIADATPKDDSRHGAEDGEEIRVCYEPDNDDDDDNDSNEDNDGDYYSDEDGFYEPAIGR